MYQNYKKTVNLVKMECVLVFKIENSVILFIWRPYSIDTDINQKHEYDVKLGHTQLSRTVGLGDGTFFLYPFCIINPFNKNKNQTVWGWDIGYIDWKLTWKYIFQTSESISMFWKSTMYYISMNEWMNNIDQEYVNRKFDTILSQ